MKLISKSIVIILVALISGLCISWEVQDARLIKKLDKQIGKLWKEETPEKHEMLIKSEDPSLEDRQFYKLVLKDSIKGYAVLSRSYGCRVGGCAVYSSTTDKSGSYDPFYYSLITDENFVIKNVKVLEFYSEYGYQITSKKWLAQFIGLDGQNLEYDKDVDAISGATISVMSLLDDIEIASKMLRESNASKLTIN